MSMWETTKRLGFKTLTLTGADGLFRWRNRNRLLVVMYHGVTCQRYEPPVWTQLPEDVFARQLEFLRRHYRFITLSCLLEVLRGEREMPQRAALLTFDDGLRNNATVAYPLLKLYRAPAAVFLTTGLIGGNRLLWFDELNLLLRAWEAQGPARSGVTGLDLPAGLTPAAAYPWLVGRLKRQDPGRRQMVLEALRQVVGPGPLPRQEDFALLDWEQVRDLAADGLVEFGTHTVNHRILTTLDPATLACELHDSKVALESSLERPVEAFCYPNGIPGFDFLPQHEEMLRDQGYRCAFSTAAGLWRPGDDPLAIGRIGVGDDGTAHPDYFRLSTSGVLEKLRRLAGRGRRV